MLTSKLEKNCSYLMKYETWKYFPNGKADFKVVCDNLVILDHKTEYGVDKLYFLKSSNGNPFWVKERHIRYAEKIDPKCNSRTHRDVEDSLFQFKDKDKPNWHLYFVRKYGNENVSFRSKTGWVFYDVNVRSGSFQERRVVLETFPERQGVHTEYENDFLLSSWERKGSEVWIEKEGKYNQSYREHYFPGEKERFLQEVYASKIRMVWEVLESTGIFVEKFQVEDGNTVKGLPTKESVDFVKEQNLKKGVYKKGE